MKRLMIMSLFFIASLPLFSQGSSAVTGKWYTKNKKSVVKIYKSGDQYHGKIVWLKNPRNDDGSVKRDVNNPKSSLRDRKILGLRILKGFSYDGDGEWDGGKIYDPEKGKTYKAQMELKSKNKLEVRGYVGVPALGRSTIWKRKE